MWVPLLLGVLGGYLLATSDVASLWAQVVAPPTPASQGSVVAVVAALVAAYGCCVCAPLWWCAAAERRTYGEADGRVVTSFRANLRRRGSVTE
jgi:hypothetical protein